MTKRSMGLKGTGGHQHGMMRGPGTTRSRLEPRCRRGEVRLLAPLAQHAQLDRAFQFGDGLHQGAPPVQGSRPGRRPRPSIALWHGRGSACPSAGQACPGLRPPGSAFPAGHSWPPAQSRRLNPWARRCPSRGTGRGAPEWVHPGGGWPRPHGRRHCPYRAIHRHRPRWLGGEAVFFEAGIRFLSVSSSFRGHQACHRCRVGPRWWCWPRSCPPRSPRCPLGGT